MGCWQNNKTVADAFGIGQCNNSLLLVVVVATNLRKVHVSLVAHITTKCCQGKKDKFIQFRTPLCSLLLQVRCRNIYYIFCSAFKTNIVHVVCRHRTGKVSSCPHTWGASKGNQCPCDSVAVCYPVFKLITHLCCCVKKLHQSPILFLTRHYL